MNYPSKNSQEISGDVKKYVMDRNRTLDNSERVWYEVSFCLDSRQKLSMLKGNDMSNVQIFAFSLCLNDDVIAFILVFDPPLSLFFSILIKIILAEITIEK